MRNPRDTGRLIRRSGAIPKHMHHNRCAVVFNHHHLQAIIQCKISDLISNIGRGSHRNEKHTNPSQTETKKLHQSPPLWLKDISPPHGCNQLVSVFFTCRPIIAHCKDIACCKLRRCGHRRHRVGFIGAAVAFRMRWAIAAGPAFSKNAHAVQYLRCQSPLALQLGHCSRSSNPSPKQINPTQAHPYPLT